MPQSDQWSRTLAKNHGDSFRLHRQVNIEQARSQLLGRRVTGRVPPWNFSTVFAVKRCMKQDHPVAGSRWVHVSILVGVGLFILALTLSAVFVPQLRLL